jgi:hypothetical protein
MKIKLPSLFYNMKFPFSVLNWLSSLWLGGGLSPGLFQVPKERLSAYARGRDFERTRNPLLFPLVMLIVNEALEKIPVTL